MIVRQELMYLPVRIPFKKNRFNILQTILTALSENNVSLRNGDIVVISSKFMALAEGRVVRIPKVKPSMLAERLALRVHMTSQMAELVLRESDVLFGGVPGFVLSIKDGIIAPNAGIDRSNIHPDYAIIYPNDPFQRAEQIRKKILLHTSRKVGIIITDSRLLPTRKGTTGLALAASGFDLVKDDRGRKDLFGNTMKVTQRAIADDISAGAHLLMGETDERIPVVIARNTGIEMIDTSINRRQLMINHDECAYVRGLFDTRILLDESFDDFDCKITR
jgi:coenzyme F420-0:L-glutamate ligase/coenzyme F420-1:gamma-L-glutamate ligase